MIYLVSIISKGVRGDGRTETIWIEHGAFYSHDLYHFVPLMQNLGNISCYYLNVGVWLFLFISGFLYGKKDISNVTVFYKKRLVRILVPYYIMLGVIILVNLLLGDSITAKELISSILCLQWYGKTVPNCGHLWYISCILFCYLITPILQWICEQNENKSLIKKCMLLVLAVLMLQVIYSLGGMKQATTSILPYILGYFMSFNKITLNSRGGVQHCYSCHKLGIVLRDVCI